MTELEVRFVQECIIGKANYLLAQILTLQDSKKEDKPKEEKPKQGDK